MLRVASIPPARASSQQIVTSVRRRGVSKRLTKFLEVGPIADLPEAVGPGDIHMLPGSCKKRANLGIAASMTFTDSPFQFLDRHAMIRGPEMPGNGLITGARYRVRSRTLGMILNDLQSLLPSVAQYFTPSAGWFTGGYQSSLDEKLLGNSLKYCCGLLISSHS